jgi:hypothetical protein
MGRISHRAPRRSLLERCGLRRRPRTTPAPSASIPAQRRSPGIELVDAQTHVRHTADDAELIKAGREGKCRSRCGVLVLVASMTDPGRIRCTKPACYL